MILQTIFWASLLQGAINLLAFSLGKKQIRYVTLVWVLIAYFFILPTRFAPQMDHERIKCGMPMLAVTMGFWIFGSSSAIFTHFFTSALFFGLKGKPEEDVEMLDEEMD